jgi:hypothetical protein
VQRFLIQFEALRAAHEVQSDVCASLRKECAEAKGDLDEVNKLCSAIPEAETPTTPMSTGCGREVKMTWRMAAMRESHKVQQHRRSTAFRNAAGAEKQAKKELGEANVLLKQLHASLFQARKLFDHLCGPREAALLSVLELHGIRTQQYHGGTFVGDHIKTMMGIACRRDMIEILPQKERNKFHTLFHKCEQAFKLYTLNRTLKPLESQELIIRLVSLGNWWPTAFPEYFALPKLHVATFHMILFVRRWNTLGLMTEQGGEAIHWAAHRMECLFPSVRNRAKKLQLVLQRMQQRNHTLGQHRMEKAEEEAEQAYF